MQLAKRPHRRGAGVAAVGQILRLLRGGARPRAGAAARPATSTSTGARCSSTCCSNIRSSRTIRSSPSTCGWTGSAARSLPRCGSCRRAAPCAPSISTARAASFISTRAGTRRCCASSCRGFWHILDGTDHLLFLACLVIPVRRLRPLVVIVTAFTVAHSITLFASAFGFAPDATVVSAADRNADRRHHRLHGAGKHRSGAARPGAALDLCLRVRIDPRLRVLVRLARAAAVRRRPSRHLAARVQPRGRDRPALGLARAGAGAQPVVQIRGRRTDRGDHPVRPRRAHRLALDDRARRAARQVPVPETRCRLLGQPDARPDGGAHPHAGVWLASGFVRRWLGTDLGVPAADAERRSR